MLLLCEFKQKLNQFIQFIIAIESLGAPTSFKSNNNSNNSMFLARNIKNCNIGTIIYADSDCDCLMRFLQNQVK